MSEIGLYHCDICKKDLSSQLRIRCAECNDFDLCVSCFYEGKEKEEHKSHHDYYVINDLSFPLFTENWSGEEEKLLLEGIQKFGLGNWKAIGKHVSSKSSDQCEYHYWNTYIDTPTFPVPSVPRATGGNELTLPKEPSTVCVKKDDRGMLLSIMKKANPPLKPYEVPQEGKFDCIRKKGNEVIGSSVGYIPLRKGFATEHCDKAEKQAIALMGIEPSYQLKESSINNDVPYVNVETGETSFYSSTLRRSDPFKKKKSYIDRMLKQEELKELKQKMLKSYDHKVQERERRDRFIIERHLYDFKKYRNRQNKMTREEKEIYNTYKRYMRFMKKEEFDNFLSGLLKEIQLTKQIHLLKSYRRNGIRTIAQAKRFEIEKRMRDPNYSFSGSSKKSSHQKKKNKNKNKNEEGNLEYLDKLSSSDSSVIEVLGEEEMKMVNSLDVPISQYLLIKDMMIKESHRLGYLSKNTAKKMFRVEDDNLTGKIYDYCVYCGWMNPDKRKMKLGIY